MKNIRLKVLWFVLAVSIGLFFYLSPAPVKATDQSNFHEIVASEAYRSAQMNGKILEDHLRQNHIKSILNLRSVPERSEGNWYDDELSVAKRKGVSHYDYPLTGADKLNSNQIDEIIEIMRKAPKPLLIHCRIGADRTGLAAALYQYKISGLTPAEAANTQLCVRYGHNIALNPATKAMDDSFWEYVKQPAKRVTQ